MGQTIERAAGGVVIRNGGNGREVLLIDDAYGHVTFPKGHVERGETWEDAAVREIQEETGIEARVLAPLGRVEYPVHRDGVLVRKQVRFFLLEEIDEVDEPVAQAEEVLGAYFLPWDEAKKRHDENGYDNWSWVFAKADALWRWHEQHYEQVWRSLTPTTESSKIDSQYTSVRPWMQDLVRTLYTELSIVAPEILGDRAFKVNDSLPTTVSNPSDALRNAIEHTLLKPEASALDIARVCEEAKQHSLKAVCVNPFYVKQMAQALSGTEVIPCTVVGFPLGAAELNALVEEALHVTAAGARDVDMVLPIGAMREDDIWTVYEYVKQVCDAVHRTSGAMVKVILENHFLTYAQVAMASLICMCAGADFVKTSTGFAPSGAKLADVALMSFVTGKQLGVKAAGGVRTRADGVQFLRYGATRIGTSSGTAMIRK